jgi:hypothetical protein
LDGHDDFKLENENNFVVEPGSQPYKCKVKFTSRISDSMSARITFTNKKESNVSAAALVFELKSLVVGRVSEKIWTTNSMLYEQTDFAIQIQNKSNFDGDFNITIIHEQYKKEENKRGK